MAGQSGPTDKPAILIIGGLGTYGLGVPSPTGLMDYSGYIGRFLALHIHNNQLASEIRLVDKVLPQLAWLAPEFQDACSQEKFLQADASRERRWCCGIELGRGTKRR